MHSIRLPNKTHESRPWRIREIARDFTLEDVWALPVYGGTEDFQTLLENLVSFNPANAESLPARVLWRFRDRLGRWFGLGSISAPINSGRDRGTRKLAIPGTNETSLTCRLPGDLRNTAADLAFDVLPFAPHRAVADKSTRWRRCAPGSAARSTRSRNAPFQTRRRVSCATARRHSRLRTASCPEVRLWTASTVRSSVTSCGLNVASLSAPREFLSSQFGQYRTRGHVPSMPVRSVS